MWLIAEYIIQYFLYTFLEIVHEFRLLWNIQYNKLVTYCTCHELPDRMKVYNSRYEFINKKCQNLERIYQSHPSKSSLNMWSMNSSLLSVLRHRITLYQTRVSFQPAARGFYHRRFHRRKVRPSRPSRLPTIVMKLGRSFVRATSEGCRIN